MGTNDPQEEARKDEHIPTVESWNDADSKLVVTQPEGWTCKVSLQSKIGLPPKELYDLLTQPDNTHIFRSIKAVRSRKVLEDDRRGRQLVEVEQEAKWKFLCFSGTFVTKLFVDQNQRTGHIGFKLKEAGPMKKFEGTWRIQPFNQATLDENFGFRDSRKQGWFAGPKNALQGFHRRVTGHDQQSEYSLLTLEQSVLPTVTPPPPLDRFLKGIAARQVRNLLEDVQKEVDRRHADKERNKPHPSTSAAPLASLSIRLQPRHVAVQQHGSGLIITRRVSLRNPGRRTSCTR